MKTEVHASPGDIPPATWNRLVAGGSVTLRHEFWQVLAAARLESFALRLALFRDEAGTPLACAAFYVVDTDIAIFAPGPLRRLLARLRRRFPRLLRLRLVECGTPVTLNAPPVGTAGEAPPEAVLRALDALLQQEAEREGAAVIVVRDFEPGSRALLASLAGLGYRAVPGLPNTYLDIRWSSPADYLAGLKSYFRSKLLRHVRRVEALGIGHELVADFEDLAPELLAQWLVVHEGASEFQREVLTEEFYRAFSRDLAGSRALLFRRGDELVAHALLLQDGELLRWLYFGRRDAANDSLYIFAAHRVIETAIALGATRLEMGLTTYPVKLDLGADMVPLQLAIRARWRLASGLVALGYRLLNRPPPARTRSVFQDRPG